MLRSRTAPDGDDTRPGIDWIVVTANALGLAAVLLAAGKPLGANLSESRVELADLDARQSR